MMQKHPLPLFPFEGTWASNFLSFVSGYQVINMNMEVLCAVSSHERLDEAIDNSSQGLADLIQKNADTKYPTAIAALVRPCSISHAFHAGQWSVIHIREVFFVVPV